MTSYTTKTIHESNYFTTINSCSKMRTYIPKIYYLFGGVFLKEYTVKQVAELLGKNEETIKRWIRSGKLPNSYRNSDKEGWRIHESDLLNLNNFLTINKIDQQNNDLKWVDETELAKLAYQAVR
jgi:excisionase family DNA binding protein